MESRHQIGLDSYDRFFPNQDTMPKGGFGNLIALPLQKLPRANGNSVFVDEEFRPYPDQWEHLASVKRMPTDAVEAVVVEAQKRGDLIGVRVSVAENEEVDPWMLPPSQTRAERAISGPFPAKVQIVRSNLVYIEKSGLPPAMLNRLLRLAAFQNPEFYRAQAMRLPTFNKPRVIACGDDLANYIALPRGCFVEVGQLFENHHIKTVIRDERFAGRQIDAEFSGQLRPAQLDAASMIAQHDTLRAYRFLKNRFSSLVDCDTKGEYARAGPSPAIARPVVRQISDVSETSGRIHWSSRRWKDQTQWPRGYCNYPKHSRQGRSERLRCGIRSGHCR